MCAARVAYDKQVADFEALECVRSQRQRREACEGKEEPPDGGGDSGGAQAAGEAVERYLSNMPAAHQTREAVSDGMGEREDGLLVRYCVMPPCCWRFVAVRTSIIVRRL